MRLFNIFACLTLACLFVFSCSERKDWVSYRGEKGYGYTPNAIYPPLGRRWVLELQKNKAAATHFNPPLVMGDVIYFGSSDKNFYAFDLTTGYKLWSFKTKGAVNSIPFVYLNEIYFASNDGNLYALNRLTGKKIWSFQTGKTVQSQVMRYENRIIFASDKGHFFFLKPDGTEEHRLPIRNWEHMTFQVYDDFLYWAPIGERLGAYDIKNRRFTWKEPIGGTPMAWYSFPAVDKDYVYYARSVLHRGEKSVGFRYVARDRLTGKQVWMQQDNFKASGDMGLNRNTLFLRYIDQLDYLAPSLWKDLVIFTSGDLVVRAFNKKTGKLVWKKEFDFPTSSAPTIAGDRIYFGLRGDEREDGEPLKRKSKNRAGYGSKKVQEPRLLCISARDGEKLWEFKTNGAILSAPVISGSRIMFGTNQYQFYVLEEVF